MCFLDLVSDLTGAVAELQSLHVAFRLLTWLTDGSTWHLTNYLFSNVFL